MREIQVLVLPVSKLQMVASNAMCTAVSARQFSVTAVMTAMSCHLQEDYYFRLDC